MEAKYQTACRTEATCQLLDRGSGEVHAKLRAGFASAKQFGRPFAETVKDRLQLSTPHCGRLLPVMKGRKREGAFRQKKLPDRSCTVREKISKGRLELGERRQDPVNGI